MEQKKIVWISQKILAEDPGAITVEWDTFNIGMLEDGMFRTVYTCWDQADADYLIASLRWFSEFQEGHVYVPKKPTSKRVIVKKEKKESL